MLCRLVYSLILGCAVLATASLPASAEDLTAEEAAAEDEAAEGAANAMSDYASRYRQRAEMTRHRLLGLSSGASGSEDGELWQQEEDWFDADDQGGWMTYRLPGERRVSSSITQWREAQQERLWALRERIREEAQALREELRVSEDDEEDSFREDAYDDDYHERHDDAFDGEFLDLETFTADY